MSTKRDTPPSNLRSLQARIDNEAAARNQPVRRIMRAVANVAVGQMLPTVVVVEDSDELKACSEGVKVLAQRRHAHVVGVFEL